MASEYSVNGFYVVHDSTVAERNADGAPTGNYLGYFVVYEDTGKERILWQGQLVYTPGDIAGLKTAMKNGLRSIRDSDLNQARNDIDQALSEVSSEGL